MNVFVRLSQTASTALRPLIGRGGYSCTLCENRGPRLPARVWAPPFCKPSNYSKRRAPVRQSLSRAGAAPVSLAQPPLPVGSAGAATRPTPGAPRRARQLERLYGTLPPGRMAHTLCTPIVDGTREGFLLAALPVDAAVFTLCSSGQESLRACVGVAERVGALPPAAQRSEGARPLLFSGGPLGHGYKAPSLNSGHPLHSEMVRVRRCTPSFCIP